MISIFLKNRLIIIVIYILSFIKSYILLNFNRYNNYQEPDNYFSPEKFIEYYMQGDYRGHINIGTPPQNVKIQFNSEKYGLSMIEDSNETEYYNKKLSSSLQKTDIYDSNYRFSKPIILNDSIIFEKYDINSKKNTKININNYPFIYLNSDENEFNIKEDSKAFINIGMKIYCSWTNELCESIPYYLKQKKQTNSYSFNVIYSKNNYDMSFIIGEEPHIYSPSIYSENNLIYSKALISSRVVKWVLEFKFFYLNESYIINKNTDLNYISVSDDDKKIFIDSKARLEFLFDMDVIISERQFFFSINRTYFSKYTDQCNLTHVPKKYLIFTCDKNFNTKNFPTLYFFHQEYNYTFELNGKDLFMTKGDKKYFLIVYDYSNSSPWIMGKIFLKKYLFLFDDVNKKIGFYRKLEKLDNDNTLLIVVCTMGILIIIFGIGGFILGKKLYGIVKKKRANELEDDYDYDSTNKGGNKNNEGLIED